MSEHVSAKHPRGIPLGSCSNGSAAYGRYIRFAFPPALAHLSQALLEPLPDYSAIGRGLSLDPVLTGAALHLAGATASGGLPICHFAHVAAIVGARQLLDLVLSYPLHLRLHSEPLDEPAAGFANWRITIWSAVAAEELAMRLIPGQSSEAYCAVLLKKFNLLTMQDAAYAPSLSSATMGQENLLLAQLIELAGEWAEAMYGQSREQERLKTTEQRLSESLALSLLEVENIRSLCEARFFTLLRSLDIDPPYPSGTAESILSLMHNLSLLASGLRPEQHGLAGFARGVGDHLLSYWNVDRWELSLRLPGSSLSLFFRQRSESGGSGEPEEREPLVFADLSWNPDFSRYTLGVAGEQWGQLCVPPLPRRAVESLVLYLRFVSLTLETYHLTTGPIHRKVETFSCLPQGVARLDANGYFIDANERFLALFSLPAPPLHATAFELFQHRFDLDLKQVWRSVAASPSQVLHRDFVASPLAGTQESSLVLYLSKLKEGRELLLQISKAEDLDALQVAALQEKDFFTHIFATMPELVLTLDSAGHIVWASRYSQELVGKEFFTVVQPASSFFQGVWDVAFLAGLTQTSLVEASFQSGAAGLSLFELSITPMASHSGHSFLVVGRDVNAAQRLEERARHPVTHDGLTGLFSHSQCQLLLESEEEKSRRLGLRLGIIALDIDRFGMLNTMYGYQTGDVILRRVAAGINAAVRKGIDLVCRYSNDEFVVLAPEGEESLLENLARSIRQSVRANCREAADVRCGLALCDPQGPPFRQRLAAARDACELREPGGLTWADVSQ